jgi:hypothetical protein
MRHPVTTKVVDVHPYFELTSGDFFDHQNIFIVGQIPSLINWVRQDKYSYFWFLMDNFNNEKMASRG